MKFPDEYFEITGSSKDDYYKKVELGKVLSKDLNVLFCATCKNVADYIERTLSLVHETGKMFKNYDVFLYENNSSDNTVEIIKQDEKVILETETLPDASYERSSVSFYQRCQFIANARNKYVDYINNNASEYDYVFVFDTDLKGGWSKEGILTSVYYLESNAEYDCMTSYCVVGGYGDLPLEKESKFNWLMFDSYAFRFYDDNSKFPMDIANYNRIKVSKGANPLRVKSNFNGLGIYRPSCFKENYYSVLNHGQDQLTDIDHVTFHKMMENKGMSVFMNPSMITCVSKHRYSEDY